MQTRDERRELKDGVVDSLNLTAIFAMFLKDTLQKFLEDTGRFLMFPLAAMTASIHAILAWRQANGQNGTTTRAIVETGAAVAVTTAVVGGFVAAAVFATVSPIIFTATMAAKTLYHAATALFFWGKSDATPKTDENRKVYRNIARVNAVGAVAGALATVAVGLVMIAAKPIVAILGVIAGAIGTVFSLWNLRKSPKPAQSPRPVVQPTIQPTVTQPEVREQVRPTVRPVPTPVAPPVVVTRTAEIKVAGVYGTLYAKTNRPVVAPRVQPVSSMQPRVL